MASPALEAQLRVMREVSAVVDRMSKAWQNVKLRSDNEARKAGMTAAYLELSDLPTEVRTMLEGIEDLDAVGRRKIIETADSKAKFYMKMWGSELSQRGIPIPDPAAPRTQTPLRREETVQVLTPPEELPLSGTDKRDLLYEAFGAMKGLVVHDEVMFELMASLSDSPPHVWRLTLAILPEYLFLRTVTAAQAQMEIARQLIAALRARPYSEEYRRHVMQVMLLASKQPVLWPAALANLHDMIAESGRRPEEAKIVDLVGDVPRIRFP